MSYIFEYLYSGIVNLINDVVQHLSDFLPLSPFRPYIEQLSNVPWIGILNYFVPVGIFLDILLAWASALGLFYVYSIILRWVKVIGD